MRKEKKNKTSKIIGRDKPILEIDLKLDDLLEKVPLG